MPTTLMRAIFGLDNTRQRRSSTGEPRPWEPTIGRYTVAPGPWFAITNPGDTMRSADNVTMALGFTRDDD